MSFVRPITNSSRTSADPDDRDPLVDLAAHRPAADALGDREDDVAAVERQERQQVEKGDRERDEPEHEEEALGALLGRVGGALDDADGARDLLAPSALTSRPREAPMSRVTCPVRAECLADGLVRRQGACPRA